MDEDPEAGEMVLGLSAVVVEDDTLPQGARGDDGRNGRQEKRPVRGGEDVHHVGATQADQAREEERLVQKGAHVGAAAEPPEPGRERRVDRNERDFMAVLPQRGGECSRLDPLPPQDLQARRDESDLRAHL